MIDLAIITAPRSGSHMLGTAIGCHPDVNFCGEYGIKDVVTVEGKLNLAIIHIRYYAKAVKRGVLPFKRIFLRRALSKRLEAMVRSGSLDRGHPDFSSMLHYLEPKVFYLKQKIEMPDEMEIQTKDSACLDSLILQQSEIPVIQYDEMTNDVDMREIPKEYKALIDNHFGLTPGHAYIPTYFKPEIRSTIQCSHQDR